MWTMSPMEQLSSVEKEGDTLQHARQHEKKSVLSLSLFLSERTTSRYIKDDRLDVFDQ